MPKYLRLYNKNGELLKTSKNIEGNTGVITIENLFPETLYHEGDFLVSWVINGNELSKAPVPEFRTLELMDNKTIVVYFSDITEEQLIALKGDSAYKIALDNGFRGTQQDWLDSLKGEPGEQGEPGKDGVDITEGGSAYEIAQAHGFEGTREEWLESLKGEPGEPGEPGKQGEPGEDGFGVDGASAYEIALENGFVGNIQDFLDSLVGEPGRDGQDGNDGLSAYQLAVDNGFSGTQEEWIESLKGEKGEPGEKGNPGNDGQDGLSAYQIALVNGYTGTEQEWLNSLKANIPDTTNWQKYKFTNDDGTRQYLIKGSFSNVNDLPPGSYETVGATDAESQGLPKEASNAFIELDITQSNKDGRKQIFMIINYSKRVYLKVIHTNGVDRGWMEFLSTDNMHKIITVSKDEPTEGNIWFEVTE